MKLILQNGRVIDPANGVDERRDLGICDGVLADPANLAADPETEIVDLAGKVAAPGLIDMHVHLREPGQEYKEDIASGARAAAAGGFATVLAMPNTQPPIDRVERVRDLRTRIGQNAAIRVLMSACLTRDRAGRELTNIRALADETDLVALTDDGDCVQDRDLMRRALELAAATGLAVVDHCEDRAVRDRGVIRQGAIADELGVQGMPGEAESDMVRRDLELCRETGAALHLQHLSCRESVRLLRDAQAQGLPISAEATPHHFALTMDDVPRLGPNAKMNPPLGTDEDRQALLEALADGAISVIASDHAPHAPAEKDRGLAHAPFGVIGLETALPLSLTTLYHTGTLSLLELIARFTTGPARALKLELGTLELGKPADVTIFDPDEEYNIDVQQSCSKSRNSPFDKMRVKGRVYGTICAGNWAFREL